MGRRPSTSSEVSSALSEATTVQSCVKDPKAAKPPRRGLRQKARDVLSDMGSPPTKRHDAKDGKPPKNYEDLGLMGAALTAQTARI